MLKTIMKTLNGHGSEVASLEAALLQLGRDREESRIKIGSLQKQRHQALLDDASDAELDKLDRLLDRATVRLEKLNAAEPPLLERLTGARTAARQRRWNELRNTYVTAAGEFLAAARAAADKHTAVIAIMTRARREGFEGEASATMPATANVNGNALLAPDLLDIFERAIAPVSAPVRKVAAIPYAPERKKEADGETRNQTVSLAIPPPNPLIRLTAQRSVDDVSPLAPGEVRVMALRNGWAPRDDAPQCHAGQQLKMPVGAAQVAANRGLVEILEEMAPANVPSTPSADVSTGGK
jgi:hypothetical protein